MSLEVLVNQESDSLGVDKIIPFDQQFEINNNTSCVWTTLILMILAGIGCTILTISSGKSAGLIIFCIVLFTCFVLVALCCMDKREWIGVDASKKYIVYKQTFIVRLCGGCGNNIFRCIRLDDVSKGYIVFASSYKSKHKDTGHKGYQSLVKFMMHSGQDKTLCEICNNGGLPERIRDFLVGIIPDKFQKEFEMGKYAGEYYGYDTGANPYANNPYATAQQYAIDSGIAPTPQMAPAAAPAPEMIPYGQQQYGGMPMQQQNYGMQPQYGMQQNYGGMPMQDQQYGGMPMQQQYPPQNYPNPGTDLNQSGMSNEPLNSS
ncbi:MAG: hypothetical protein MJ252_18845 [archaeon]|nr:hypothetical protein [archaeon]